METQCKSPIRGAWPCERSKPIAPYISEEITTPTPAKKSVYARKTSCVDTHIDHGFFRDQGGPHYKSSAENDQFRAATNPCCEGRAPASTARTGWGGPRGLNTVDPATVFTKKNAARPQCLQKKQQCLHENIVGRAVFTTFPATVFTKKTPLRANSVYRKNTLVSATPSQSTGRLWPFACVEPFSYIL